MRLKPSSKFSTLLVAPLLVFIASCATVDSTIDSFGDDSIKRDTKLFFVTDGVPMEMKRLVALCEEAAIAKRLNVWDEPCKDCVLVNVEGQLGGTSTKIGSYTTYNYRKSTVVPTTYTSSETLHSRVIKVSFYQNNKDKTELRSITARSSGDANSVAKVAKQMCLSIFKDFPKNLDGEEYSVKE